jgi:hypothetical protein
MPRSVFCCEHIILKFPFRTGQGHDCTCPTGPFRCIIILRIILAVCCLEKTLIIGVAIMLLQNRPVEDIVQLIVMACACCKLDDLVERCSGSSNAGHGVVSSGLLSSSPSTIKLVLHSSCNFDLAGSDQLPAPD